MKKKILAILIITIIILFVYKQTEKGKDKEFRKGQKYVLIQMGKMLKGCQSPLVIIGVDEVGFDALCIVPEEQCSPIYNSPVYEY